MLNLSWQLIKLHCGQTALKFKLSITEVEDSYKAEKQLRSINFLEKKNKQREQPDTSSFKIHEKELWHLKYLTRKTKQINRLLLDSWVQFPLNPIKKYTLSKFPTF